MDNFDLWRKAMRDAMFLAGRVENLGRDLQRIKSRFETLNSQAVRNITVRLKVSDDGEIMLVDPPTTSATTAAIDGEEE